MGFWRFRGQHLCPASGTHDAFPYTQNVWVEGHYWSGPQRSSLSPNTFPLFPSTVRLSFFLHRPYYHTSPVLTRPLEKTDDEALQYTQISLSLSHSPSFSHWVYILVLLPTASTNQNLCPFISIPPPLTSQPSSAIELRAYFALLIYLFRFYLAAWTIATTLMDLYTLAAPSNLTPDALPNVPHLRRDPPPCHR